MEVFIIFVMNVITIPLTKEISWDRFDLLTEEPVENRGIKNLAQETSKSSPEDALNDKILVMNTANQERESRELS